MVKKTPQLIITKSWIFKQEKLQVRIYCKLQYNLSKQYLNVFWVK